MPSLRPSILVACMVTGACAEADPLAVGGYGGEGAAPRGTGNTSTKTTGTKAAATGSATKAATTGATTSGGGCGDGTCDAGETCSNCPTDCDMGCSACGNGVCGAGETEQNCPQDCMPAEMCGDGFCGAMEDEFNCPGDCMGGGTSGSGMGMCAHDPCQAGPKLEPTCDLCASAVCLIDSYCCDVEWDDQCLLIAVGACGC